MDAIPTTDAPVSFETEVLMEAAAREIKRAVSTLVLVRHLLAESARNEYPFYEDGYFDPPSCEAWKSDGANALMGICSAIDAVLSAGSQDLLVDAQDFFRAAHANACRERASSEEDEIDMPF